jgi:hypothetical protein
MFRMDPGACPICGAPHTACTADRNRAITMAPFPARDALPPRRHLAVERLDEPPAELEVVVVPTDADESFTTGTYDRSKHGLRRKPAR